MKNSALYTILVFLFGCLAKTQAQTGFYVPPSGRIFFIGDSVTIFSNTIVAGKLGIGRNAVINFKGQRWENEAGSLITDETSDGDGFNGSGGWLRFNNDQELQSLYGAYNAASRTGPAFARLELANRYGLELNGGSSKILSQLKFTSGLFYLNNNILAVGNNNPGIIEGYDSSKFLVTSNSPGNGLLLRENITNPDGIVVFPIGSKPHAYTPGAVHQQTLSGDDYYMGVFDSVKADVITGENLQDISVNKTWELGKLNKPGTEEAYLYFQHLVSDEGSVFSARRNATYISHYNGSNWDSTLQHNTPSSGFLTTGAPLTNSGVNNRQQAGLVGPVSYFTKFASINSPLPVETKALLNAYRTSWQLVKVYWTTRLEVDQDYFVVQRRLGNETAFRNIDTVRSKAPNGNSILYLDYSINDENSYTGISYYRLLLVNKRNEQAYSNMVAIKGKQGEYEITLWPNPTRGRFIVTISGSVAVKSILVYDIKGRLIREEKLRDRSIIEMHIFLPGSYMLSFIGKDGQILETKKLLVQPY